MSDLPRIELLEKTHTFPGPYMFKVIGPARNGFLARVVAAVREELAQAVDPPYRLRETAQGGYVAITMEPIVQSAQQVLGVYRRLGLVGGIMMLW